MDLSARKNILEVYGLARLVYGCALLVGLSAGYLLKELIIQYPAGVEANVFDEDLVALVYLIVLWRGIFHVLAGVGIARIRLWGCHWLIWGWLFSVLVTFGTAHSFNEAWTSEGFASGLSSVLWWPGVLAYLIFMLFEMIVLTGQIRWVNNNASGFIDESIDPKKIFLVLFGALFFFGTFLFLSAPLKKGFYPGFYKSRGIEKSVGTQIKPVSKPQQIQAINLDQSKHEEKPEALVAETVKVVKASMGVEAKNQSQEIIKPPMEQKAVPRGVPLQAVVGLGAGACIAIGFLIMLLGLPSVVSFIWLSVGFLGWIIYGIMVKLLPISLTSFIVLIILVCIILKEQSNN